MADSNYCYRFYSGLDFIIDIVIKQVLPQF